MKLVKIAKTKKMLKVEIDGKEEWTNISEAVYNYAKSKFKEGDEIGLEYNEQGGMKFVTRIAKPGQSQSNSSNSKSDKPTCSDCGVELKDNRYKKCYNCNKKNLPPKKEKLSYYAKSPEDKEQIKRLSVLSSAAKAAEVVQGQVDVNALSDYVLNLYNAFYKKVSE